MGTKLTKKIRTTYVPPSVRGDLPARYGGARYINRRSCDEKIVRGSK